MRKINKDFCIKCSLYPHDTWQIEKHHIIPKTYWHVKRPEGKTVATAKLCRICHSSYHHFLNDRLGDIIYDLFEEWAKEMDCDTLKRLKDRGVDINKVKC